jgi:hypothetical protein
LRWHRGCVTVCLPTRIEPCRHWDRQRLHLHGYRRRRMHGRVSRHEEILVDHPESAFVFVSRVPVERNHLWTTGIRTMAVNFHGMAACNGCFWLCANPCTQQSSYCKNSDIQVRRILGTTYAVSELPRRKRWPVVMPVSKNAH